MHAILEERLYLREYDGLLLLKMQGITGPPGAGKSSLIEKFGKYLTTTIDARVAVLTVDPSSTATGGMFARESLIFLFTLSFSEHHLAKEKFCYKLDHFFLKKHFK